MFENKKKKEMEILIDIPYSKRFLILTPKTVNVFLSGVLSSYKAMPKKKNECRVFMCTYQGRCLDTM